MKEIKKELTRIEYMTYYEAWDGETFLTKKECEDYERSAACVLMHRLEDCVIANEYNTEMFDDCDENKYKTVVPQVKADIDTLNQLWFLFRGANTTDAYFTYSDIGKPVIVGYRIYNSTYDFVWFYMLSGVIDAVTEGKFRLVRTEDYDSEEQTK